MPGRKGKGTLFDAPIEEALNSARTVLVDVALMPELDRNEAQAASRAIRRATQQAEKARLLFDAAVLNRIGRGGLVAGYDPDSIVALAATKDSQAALSSLRVAHMPVLFPEVFLRANGGFDVLIGNPPWEKLKVEEHQWWALRFPGLRSMPMAQRTPRIAALRDERPELVAEFESDVEANRSARQVIAAGPYPGLGSGDIDLFQAFAWRNWQLVREGGALGVLLPRGALSGSGTERWRRAVLRDGAFSDVVMATNSRGWLFEAIHPQYTVGLVCVRRSVSDGNVRFVGSCYSRAEFESARRDLAAVPVEEFANWTPTASFPLIPDRSAGEIFRQMRSHPPLTGGPAFDFRRVREIESTDKKLFSTDLSAPLGGVPVLTGASFNIWEPDFGKPYAFASSELADHVLAKILNSAKSPASAFHGLGITSTADLPMSRARIMVRDVCRPTDSRTTIVCLVPPGVTGIEKAPYLLRRSGTEVDEAFVLGMMSSLPFDWFARRVVELSMNLEVLSSLPIPRPSHADRAFRRVVEIAGTLAARDERYRTWAKSVGVQVGGAESPSVRDEMICELDAWAAHLYGLNREQLRRVFTSFHRGWGYEERLSRVLIHFDTIEVDK